MTTKIWLGIDENSQTAKVIKRLLENPAIKTKDLAPLWLNRSRKGGVVPVSGSRAAFLAEVLGDATGGLLRPRKGVSVLTGIRDSIRTDDPGHAVVQVHQQKTVEVVTQSAPAPTPGLGIGKSVEVQGSLDTRDVTKAEAEQFIFPDAPVQPKALAHFIKPDWYDEFRDSLRDGYHVALAGPPGVGKSTVPEQLALAEGQVVVTINAHGGLRYRDVAGHTQVVGGRTRFLVAEYAAAAINGWWVILNEVNAADEAAILFMNGQLAPPHSINLNGKTFPVHKNFRAIVSYNPGFIGTKPLNEALKDRFEVYKVPFPTKEILREMLVANGMKRAEPGAIKLLAYAYEILDLKKRGVLRYQISPRRLYSAVRHLNRGKSVRQAITLSILNSVDSTTDLVQLEKALDTVCGKVSEEAA